MLGVPDSTGRTITLKDEYESCGPEERSHEPALGPLVSPAGLMPEGKVPAFGAGGFDGIAGKLRGGNPAPSGGHAGVGPLGMVFNGRE